MRPIPDLILLLEYTMRFAPPLFLELYLNTIEPCYALEDYWHISIVIQYGK